MMFVVLWSCVSSPEPLLAHWVQDDFTIDLVGAPSDQTLTTQGRERLVSQLADGVWTRETVRVSSPDLHSLKTRAHLDVKRGEERWLVPTPYLLATYAGVPEAGGTPSLQGYHLRGSGDELEVDSVSFPQFNLTKHLSSNPTSVYEIPPPALPQLFLKGQASGANVVVRANGNEVLRIQADGSPSFGVPLEAHLGAGDNQLTFQGEVEEGGSLSFEVYDTLDPKRRRPFSFDGTVDEQIEFTLTAKPYEPDYGDLKATRPLAYTPPAGTKLAPAAQQLRPQKESELPGPSLFLLKGEFNDVRTALRVNDVEAYSGESFTYPIPGMLIDGENTVTLTVEPTGEAPRAQVSVVSTSRQSGDKTRATLTWNAGDLQSLSTTFPVKARYRWSWQDADVVTLDPPTRAVLDTFVERLHAQLVAKDAEGFFAQFASATRDQDLLDRLDPRYHDLQRHDFWRDYHIVAQDDPSATYTVKPLPERPYTYQIGAGGRLVTIRGVETGLFSIEKSTDSGGSYSTFVPTVAFFGGVPIIVQ